jgi:hypothetical protein
MSGTCYSAPAHHIEKPPQHLRGVYTGHENLPQHLRGAATALNENLPQHLRAPASKGHASSPPEEEAPNAFMSVGALLESGRKRKGGFGAGLGAAGVGERGAKGGACGQRRRVGLAPPRGFVPPYGGGGGAAAGAQGEQGNKKNAGKGGAALLVVSCWHTMTWGRPGS